MSSFKIHDIDTAPEASKPLLENSVKAFGRIPNLHAVMAESPEHLEAYKTLHALFERTSLSKVERNVVWMTINVENACHYCVPAHTAIALMQGVDADDVEALRAESPLKDSRLEALRQFTLALVRQRGRLEEAQVAQFLDAGFTPRQILDVLVGLAQKTMSNYANHLADTPVDAAFAKFEWKVPA
ncbi:MAG: carboxymuconolactone decarboxylase family protein [Hyphomonas sp.]|uniref:carboxymuconolactone decarboxylase family protein n=1 Tax=Hyphomonas sp. TaxID=87 RepID=UPI0017907A97|nr:carboxymuconolactone decarboxylase family protein [Hyphomonas sp.]MBA3067572.1 carboxymuconolactone decarboxylase family protein [Hyphomonas sp.]MBU3920716.1 carboxymuconolactone decarboxylase family protein [Alphaproteobacteria bacterium]MBU4063461.1 carboxymuconolactone decarboxylase family protein [Alphaproteobacteria bacterium]MBU4165282.1 carboxymuconolactone decarboxylase family protein [Alphaproteobacteria bacterium]